MKKQRLLALLITCLTLSQPITAQAAVISSTTTTNVLATSSVTRADSIVYVWREYYGVIQYRRWNETRGYWVDADWITP